MLRLRITLMNGIFVRGFTRKTRHRRPLAPVTGTSFPEVTGRQTYLLEYDTPGKAILKWHPVWRGAGPEFAEKYNQTEYAFILSPPLPYPDKLYQPQVYHSRRLERSPCPNLLTRMMRHPCKEPFCGRKPRRSLVRALRGGDDARQRQRRHVYC